MMNYDESLQLLMDKVNGIVEMSWDDICDVIGVDVHPDSLRKAFATTPYGGYAVATHLMDRTAGELTDDMVERLQIKRDEEYKERVRLQDARRMYNKELREEARFENLRDVMVNEIKHLPELNIGEYKEPPFDDVPTAMLLISDLHYGATSDNVLNLYNTDVCKERMQTLLHKTLDYCKLHDVQELYVNLGGDLVHGIIHVSGRVEQEEDVISQTMHVAELLSRFIATLMENIPKVHIVGVQGNHSRVSAERKQSLNAENFERIIFEYISNRLGVPVIRNGLEDWVAYSIGNRKIFLEHGDKTNLASIRTKAINVLGYVPDEILTGHLHHMEVIEEHGTDIVVNGSVMGTDSYAMKHRLHTEPYQVLRIYNGDDVCTYKVML